MEITDKLKNLTPEQLELLRKKMAAKAAATPVETIPPRAARAEYPMTPAQKRLWFLQQLDRDSAYYSIPSAIRIAGALNVNAMEQAIQAVVNRHEVLRSYYVASLGGEPEQRIAEVELRLQLVDLSGLAGQAAEAETRRLLMQIALTPFDLTQPPLLTAALLKRPDDHVLMLNLHHIIADGWSVGILLQEIIAAYRAATHNQPAPFDEQRLQFADYAAWLSGRMTHENLDRQLDYWERVLTGMPLHLEWITDFPRPAVQSHRGRQIKFTLPKPVSDALRRISREHNTSLYQTLMAATQLFLYKYTQQKDFGIGAPVANRGRRELEDLVGFFVNTVVLRAIFDADITFDELIERVKGSLLAATENQDVPFERIVESLAPQRDLSRSPLFQVMFDLQRTPLRSASFDNLTIDLYDVDIQVAKFDMLFLLLDDGEQLQGTLEYNRELFRDSTAEQIVDYYQTLLAQIAVASQKRISQLKLITPEQERIVLEDWNATRTDYPRDKTLAQLFAASVAALPEKTAVTDANESVTYAQLNERANRLAHYLTSLGVAAGDFVAIYMERSAEMVAAMLAVIKIGACYVPIDLAYPAQRAAFMLQDTDARAVLTHSSLSANLPAGDYQLIALDERRTAVDAQSADNPPDVAEPMSAAYVIYTSGSTGLPKGVVVPQRAITRLVLNTNYVQITPEDIFAQISNAAFDAATFEIWGALLNGAKLVIFSKEVLLSSAHFIEKVRAQKISQMFVTTAYFNQLVKEFPGGLRSLKYLLFGGEMVDAAAVRSALAHHPPQHLLHVYGPTENTTFSTFYHVQSVDEKAANVPIGAPIANSTCYVLDGDGAVCPPLVPGELFVGGDGLALGYHNRPELTAERFTDNPLPTRSDRLYRTGDLVRRLPDGAIEFIARIDQQVKIRGFRVELGEIEFLLRQNPAVADVVVLARDNRVGDKQLVAYVVPKTGAHADGAALRQYLADKLPEYMIPAFFVEISAIPLNANGKVDKAALPDPAAAEQRADYVAPRTPFEKYLAELWQELLGLERVGVYDHFFEIGGNSLKAAVFANRLQNELQESVHVAALFKAPRIAEFALYAAEYYREVIEQRFGKGSAQKIGDTRFVDTGDGNRLTADDVGQFDRIIAPLAPSPRPTNRKNPRAVFVLSPPRSGSTLLRVMLAGNQRLFSPPELDLLSFNTLQERRRAFSAEGLEIWLQAPIRALMELKNLDAEAATQLMTDYETRNLTVKEFYGEMQALLGDRLLVDKTPTYPFDREILRRAEEDFEDALYIHLVRHPYAMIYSFMEAKLDENFFRHEHPFTRRQLAELIWIVSNRNILDFFKHIPAERQYRLHFENVLFDPEGELRQLCAFLGVDFQQEMLEPYKGKKMTDGVNKSTQMVGDFKFYLHKTINVDVAERWRQYHAEDFLSDVAWELAERLDYPVEKKLAAGTKSEKVTELKPQPRDGDLPLSFAQERLWFLDQFEPGNPQYNVPFSAYLKGTLNVEWLERAINLIIARHETLRTTFEVTAEGRARQVIHPPKPMRLPVVSLQALPEAEREHEAQKIADAEAAKQFDLRTGPLIRAQLIALTERHHVLVLVLHHIIADGWSTNVFIRELATAYEQLSHGQTPALPELPVQYVDYAVWQRRWLAGERMQQQLDYWKDKLSGLPELLELPTDRPRPPVVSHTGAEIIFRFSRELTQALKSLAHTHGATDFMLLMAGFQVLLARYAGQQDIAVGTPIANRVRQEIEPLIGFFVNTLVMRGDLSANPSFVDLIAQLKKTAVEAYNHQDVPFEKLVDLLQPERNTGHTPLFQVMFAMQESALESLHVADLQLSVFQISSKTAKFDLSLSMVEREGQFRGQLEYNAELFNRSTIEHMVRHFEHLLTELAREPQRRVLSVDILPAEEKELILQHWNRTKRPALPWSNIAAAFEEQVADSAAFPAVSDASKGLTYDELNQQANRLAHLLRARGVRTETRVGICLPRTVDAVVALLAVLKAGGTYVPLDPDYPRERLEYIFSDADLRFVVTLSSLAEGLPLEGRSVVFMDKKSLLLNGVSTADPRVPIDAHNIAYVIYTSGSTGRPKGVMISHGSALNLLLGLQTQVYNRLPKGRLRTSLNAPLLFDASVQQLLTLILGHHLVMLPAEVRMDGESLLAYLAEKQVDVLDCVPSQLKLLQAAGLFEKLRPLALLPGGEAIDPATWQTLRAQSTMSFNMYGPTECTVDTTAHFVNEAGETPVIGSPLANARMYVLDRRLQPVPIGVAGEICIAGAGLARGYLNRPDLTAEKFVPDPFAEEPGARMYRSGDLGRFLEDGTIEYLGRIDHQVKLRGFRMELGEIEATLKRHEQIAECVVMVREDAPGDKRLVAYFTARTGVPSATDLRAFLAGFLPDYMIPSIFVPLEKFPMTPNGKLDRKALPKPQIERDASAAYAEAATDAEKALLEIWRQVLNVESIGIDDNFFTLGGDSILTIQVLARARRQGIVLTPRDFFKQPTIRGLAALAGESSQAGVDQGPVTGIAPLSPIQRSFFALKLPQPNQWNQSLLLAVDRPLDHDALRAAVTALVNHHDALRAVFVEHDGQKVQSVAERTGEPPLLIVKVEASDKKEQKEAVERLMAEQQTSLDIAQGPICRFVYVDLPQGARLGMVVHHLAVDGVSWRILLDDLQTAYEQASAGVEIRLPEKTASYFAWSKNGRAAGDLEPWLQPFTPNALPIDFPNAVNSEGLMRLATVELNEPTTRALRQQAPQQYGIRFHELLLAATAQALARWSGGGEVALELEGHGRDGDLDVSRTVGWFTTLFPVYLKIDATNSPAAVIQSTVEQAKPFVERGAHYMAARYAPAENEKSRALGNAAKPAVSFNYLGQFDALLKDQRFRIAEESAGPERHPDNPRAYELDISARLLHGRLTVDIAYGAARFKAETIGRLSHELREVFGGIVAACTGADSTTNDYGLSDDDLDGVLAEMGLE